MKVKTRIRAGGLSANHSVTVRSANRMKAWSMKVKTKVRAGGGGEALASNHNVTVKRARTAS